MLETPVSDSRNFARSNAEMAADDDRVDQAGRDSFPASDPPSWTLGIDHPGAGQRPAAARKEPVIKVMDEKTSGEARVASATPCPEAHAKETTDRPLYPAATIQLSRKRRELVPEVDAAFREFSERVFADGALPSKIKQLIAVAVAHVTQCPYCIRGHTQAALRDGATEQELMEAIWVAAEMRAGAAFAHSAVALETMQDHASHE